MVYTDIGVNGMRATNFSALFALAALTLHACSPESATAPSETTATQGNQLNALTEGARIRVSWPGSEEAGGLPGDIVTLTAFTNDRLELTATLENSQGKGIPAQMLRVASASGNKVAKPAVVTDSNGRASVAITTSLTGQDVIHISGAGASKRLALIVRPIAGGLPEDQETFSADLAAASSPHGASLPPRNAQLATLPGVLPWRTLADGVRLHERNGVYELIINNNVKTLNGQRVKLQGFMLPLEQAEKQQHFLLTAAPATCFFCLPGGAESIVEVKSENPVAFSLEPVVISGTLEVLQNDEFGLVYRMTKAKQVDG